MQISLESKIHEILFKDNKTQSALVIPHIPTTYIVRYMMSYLVPPFETSYIAMGVHVIQYEKNIWESGTN